MIELNDYDRQWLMQEGCKHEDIAVIEDYIARFQQKYPKHGDCTACMMAYKRFVKERKLKAMKEKLAKKADDKFQQDRLNGFGKNYQDGVWAPFNGKVYHDQAKMKADARALGLEEMGSDQDIATEQKRQAMRKAEQREREKESRRQSIRESLAQSVKTH